MQQYTERLSEKLKRVANGNWPGILRAAGIDERYLVNKHGPCPRPACGESRPRFRFDNREGTGSWICTCGSGNGMSLLMELSGKPYTEAALWVLGHLGDATRAKRISDFSRKYIAASSVENLNAGELARRRAAFKQVWDAAARVQPGDPVWKYLTGRLPGLQEIPRVIRFHSGLEFIGQAPSPGQRGIRYGKHPCMVSAVLDDEGRCCNVHRTYLRADGEKLKIWDKGATEGDEPLKCKKLMPSIGAKSYAVRLARHKGKLGVSEGIETGLAAMLCEGIPTWALVSTAGMKSFNVPPDVSELVIFADNDKKTRRGTLPGFEAATALSERPGVMARVKARNLKVQLITPSRRGQDMADMLIEAQATKKSQG